MFELGNGRTFRSPEEFRNTWRVCVFHHRKGNEFPNGSKFPFRTWCGFTHKGFSFEVDGSLYHIREEKAIELISRQELISIEELNVLAGLVIPPHY